MEHPTIRFFQSRKFCIKILQRFLQSVSDTGTGRHRGLTVPATAPTGTDRPGLFYDVFDKNFRNIILFWAI
jgi:hypothetical protein